MFDSAFGEVQKELGDLSFEEYKKRYIDLIQLSESCIKESFAVT